jgi:CubicO group peptidase (beta-lactamase class C family)
VNPPRLRATLPILLLVSMLLHELAPDGRADPMPFDPALEAQYLKRFEALTDRTSRNGLPAYDTLGPLPGAPDWQSLPERAPGDRYLDSEALTAAKSYAAANRSSALLLWVDGALELEAYFGDVQVDTPLVSKSLSKPLAVIAVGRAIEQGFIDSLDQPASDFLVPWRNTEKAGITLRHLLGSRSGLLPQGAAPTADNVLNRAYLHPAHDEVIIHDYPLVDEPGSRYEYSNANFEVLAPILERATGVPYEAWLTREVLTPLGALGGEIWMNRPGGTPHSGCCALLPAETYLRLALLVLHDGIWEGRRLLPEGFVTEMRRSSPQNPHAGLGVYLGSPYLERRGPLNPEKTLGRIWHSEPYHAEDLFLFDGNSNQVAYIIPSRRTVILRTGAWAPKSPEWDNARLPNLIVDALD